MRDNYWDSLKFFLIFLVVYGHVLTIDYESGTINRGLYNFIFLFHMPLFVFISGRFSQIKNKDRYLKSIVKLFETFVVFSVFHVLSRLVMHRGSFALSHILVFPEMTMWYLECLIFWRLLALYVLPKPERLFGMGGGIMILASLMISLLAGYVPVDGAFSFQRALGFLPFFMLGYYTGGVDYKKQLLRIPSSVALIMITAIIVLFCWQLTGKYEFSGAKQYSESYGIMTRFGRDVAAIITSVLIMKIAPVNKKYAEWGKCTMFVYMYHLFFEAVLKIVVRKGFLPSGEIAIFVYSVMLTMFLVWASRYKILNIVMNPITYIVERNKKVCG